MMFRRIGTLLAAAIIVLTIVSLIKQIGTALEAGKRLDTEAGEVSLLQQQNRQLKERLAEVQKYDFIEQVAREKLNLSKRVETVVVVPDEIVEKALVAQRKVQEVKLPNWEGWLKLFIH